MTRILNRQELNTLADLTNWNGVHERKTNDVPTFGTLYNYNQQSPSFGHWQILQRDGKTLSSN